MERCQFCGAYNVKSEDILKELGCGAECRLEQMIDEDGVLILVRHEKHKGKKDGSTMTVSIN